MKSAQRGDPGIKHLRAGDAPGLEGGAELRPVALGFREQDQARDLEPCLNLVHGRG